jgi:hypothetical protein
MADIRLRENAPVAAKTDVQAELAVQEQEWFELQPIEKKLCGYSLGLGLGLLVVFVFVFGVIK